MAKTRRAPGCGDIERDIASAEKTISALGLDHDHQLWDRLAQRICDIRKKVEARADLQSEKANLMLAALHKTGKKLVDRIGRACEAAESATLPSVKARKIKRAKQAGL